MGQPVVAGGTGTGSVVRVDAQVCTWLRRDLRRRLK